MVKSAPRSNLVLNALDSSYFKCCNFACGYSLEFNEINDFVGVLLKQFITFKWKSKTGSTIDVNFVKCDLAKRKPGSQISMRYLILYVNPSASQQRVGCLFAPLRKCQVWHKKNRKKTMRLEIDNDSSKRSLVLCEWQAAQLKKKKKTHFGTL